MRQIPFLTQAEIRALQDQEVQSDKVQKRTPEQIEVCFCRIRKNLCYGAADY